MKNLRHGKIIGILGRQAVETQEDLQAILKAEGFQVTQATVSRDIKELRIFKTLAPNGKYRYAVPSGPSGQTFSAPARLRTIFRTSVTHIDAAQNIVVIKTLAGTAQGACAAIDSMNDPAVAGSIAGDDTVFVALRNENAAQELTVRLRALLAGE
jgi:transcriptional regulator of arginine metabolism